MATSPGQGKIPARYDFSPGHVLATKYEVLARVGAGRSGELYKLTERATGIERTAKFFYPHLDPTNRVATQYARKLHRLRHCDALLPYRTQETISLGGRDVTFLVSDVARGVPLPEFLKRQPGGRLTPFAGLHLLHALSVALEKVHAAGEHHGELLPENILVHRRGLAFQVKFLDLSPTRSATSDPLRDDVDGLLRLFTTVTGRLDRASPALRTACRRLRRAPRLRDAGDLRRQLEALDWS